MMLLLTLLSIGFIVLAIIGFVRPQYGERFQFDVYVGAMLIVAALLAIFPVRHLLFEMRLARVAEELIGHEHVIVDCQSTFDSIFHLGAAGFVYRDSGRINLEVRTCRWLRGYLDDPVGADPLELFSLHVLTHEAMHVAGIYNEKRADCSAFQRNHRTAILLGVPGNVAILNARDLHRTRAPSHPYYSPECEPGGGMDEKLPDAVWTKS